ncbi:septum site-determining protein MinC [Tuberibacillus sp. Marseille-P3662]|uniref:septum site-determining protein MinC n=1 Tax=Tuberibacillus sp. Marseille-P3662 TaxID=1965358 RepID=UPI001592D464|nr:septum site-determining protein MinC [Tuberibacillus sp. Marseille-P3662]
MSNKQPYITIKGKKDGLILVLDDRCSYDLLLEELKQTLDSQTVNQNEPLISVKVEMGNRYLTSDQEQVIKNIIREKKQLLVTEIQSNVITREECQEQLRKQQLHTLPKMVRSGQVEEIDGDLLLLGDVNPGGKVVATGNIYIMGSLRGLAHAGSQGNREATISASQMKPMQLQIANVWLNDEEDVGEDHQLMVSAYIDQTDEKISIDRIQNMMKKHSLTSSLS